MYYYTISPRLLAFSLFPGAFGSMRRAVDGSGRQRTAADGAGVSAGPSWRCPFLAVRGSALVALAGADCWSCGRVSSTCTKIHHFEKKSGSLYASIWGVLFILGFFPALRVSVRSVP